MSEIKDHGCDVISLKAQCHAEFDLFGQNHATIPLLIYEIKLKRHSSTVLVD